MLVVARKKTSAQSSTISGDDDDVDCHQAQPQSHPGKGKFIFVNHNTDLSNIRVCTNYSKYVG